MWIGVENDKKESKKSATEYLDYISLSYYFAVSQDGQHNAVAAHNSDCVDAFMYRHV